MDIKSNADKAENELVEFQKPFNKLMGLDNDVIVENSQFITEDNNININRLSNSEEGAVDEARYVANRQNLSLDNNEKLEELMTRFVRDYLEKVFK